MAKTKSKKKKKSGSEKVKPSDVNEIPVDGEAEDEMSAGEKFLMASKPYWAHIALGVLACIFASVLWTNFKNSSRESAALPWQELNAAMTQSDLTRDTASLKEMAANNEGKAAGNWALLLAGDEEVNRGLDMLARDRVGGLKLIGQGVDSLQKVVDAPASSKTPMVQRRSLFRLAGAKEALGEFAAAKGHYQTILDEAPDSPWAPPSKRGVARCSNENMVAIYDKFRNWDESSAVAPGPLVPGVPAVNIDGFKIPEGMPDTFSGGDFKGDMKKDQKPDVEMKMETPAVELKKDPAAEMKKMETMEDGKPAMKPGVETPKVEMPKVEIPAGEVPKMELPKTELPKVEVPKTELPTTELPKVEIPKTELPKTELPKVEVPKTELPTTELPKVEIPKTELPKTELPKVEVPKTGLPTTELPKVEIPKTGLPKVEIPKTEIPAGGSPPVTTGGEGG